MNKFQLHRKRKVSEHQKREALEQPERTSRNLTPSETAYWEGVGAYDSWELDLVTQIVASCLLSIPSESTNKWMDLPLGLFNHSVYSESFPMFFSR